MDDRPVNCDACGAPARVKPQHADSPIGRFTVWACSDECRDAELARRGGTAIDSWPTKRVKKVFDPLSIDARAGRNLYRMRVTRPDGTIQRAVVSEPVQTKLGIRDYAELVRDGCIHTTMRPALPHGRVEVWWWDDLSIKLELTW